MLGRDRNLKSEVGDVLGDQRSKPSLPLAAATPDRSDA
jgi:hypothetical protein